MLPLFVCVPSRRKRVPKGREHILRSGDGINKKVAWEADEARSHEELGANARVSMMLPRASSLKPGIVTVQGFASYLS